MYISNTSTAFNINIFQYWKSTEMCSGKDPFTVIATTIGSYCRLMFQRH